MKKRMLYLFSSSVMIKVTGININLFIRKLIRNKISIIKIIPVSYKEINLIIDYKDLDKIYSISSIFNISIIKYYGFIRFIKFIKRNIIIGISLFISIIIIYILSNIIFSIDIIHSNSNIVSLVSKELNKRGISKYSFAKNYNELEEIKRDILNNNKDTLEWLEIIKSGTKYIVRVEERVLNNKNSISNKYDLVAGKNAIIKSIIAYNGEKIKDINSYVKKGDIIVSSYITLPNNNKILSGAYGKVLGEVWYNISIDYPYYYNEIIYTGKKKKVISFNILNKSYSLFDFKKYKSFNKDSKYIFKDNIFSLSIDYEYETKIINDIYTYDTAKEKAIKVAKDKLMNKYKSIKEINKIIIISEDDNTDSINLQLFVTCTEDITDYKEVIE